MNNHHRIISTKEIRQALIQNKCPYCGAELVDDKCPTAGIGFHFAKKWAVRER